jgi:cell wall arabinan synthesis protein/EmbC-like arabinotransferase in arabinogalactan biosynthesis/arabinosyltransferase-like concanavalin domain-containing protein
VTDVSDAVRDEVVEPGGGGRDTDPPTARTGGDPVRRRGTALLAGLAALVAVVCAALLPFAPVSVNEPTVTWPVDPARPESTLLQLAAYRPLGMDVRFTCEAAALAARTPGGVVVSTAAPDSPSAGTTGLVVLARNGRLTVGAYDRTVVDEPLPTGPCEYRISGRSAGLPSYQSPPNPPIDPADPQAPDPAAFAGPGNAHLTITRDGAPLFDIDTEQLPDVDVLATSLTSVPPGGLSATLRVDDEFASSPTPVKLALVVGTLVGLLLTLVLLARLDRHTPRVPALWRPGRPRLVDLVVPAVLVVWMFVAPATDDDGYYAAMARNSALTGDVGNYYQLYDQSFTPFTWFYQALGWWQRFAGDAPVMQRIPALVFGVLTWFALRRFMVAAMREWAPGGSSASAFPEGAAPGRHDKRLRVLAHALLAVTFLAWWVPQDMGVRPETVVALAGSLTLLTVLAAGRTQRLALAWLAFLLAGVGFTAHPTGFTLFAPLLAGLPLLWPVVRVRGDRLATALRAFAVASGGVIALVMAFTDGGLRDFLRGQTIFLSIQEQDGWFSEIQRYSFLLSDIPMGNFAKRSAILVCLVALAWFAVLAVACRVRRVAVPTPMWLAGSTTAIAFAALWLTPSKWSHHFGALAGVGPVFLALMLLCAVPLTRRVLDGARVPVGVLAAAAVSFLVMILLAWRGPDDWAYAWLEGVHHAPFPPAISHVQLASPVLWVALFALAAVLGAVLTGRATRDVRVAVLRAVPVVVVLSLAATTAYTVGTFVDAAVRDAPAESIWARGWADPTGAGCGAAGVVRVYDPGSAVPLPPVSPVPAAGTAAQPAPTAPAGGRAPTPTAENPAFVEHFVTDGYYAGNRPQGPGATQLWGSLLGRDGLALELNTGRMSTGWYALPGAAPDTASTVLAAGTLQDGNTLKAVYGRRDGATVAPAGEQALTDTAHDPSWRTFTLAPPPGADVVRLEAEDRSGALHGWVAFSAPAQQRARVLADYVPAGAPVALAWPLAFGYPCLRQPRMVDGITETPQYAVLWGNTQALNGFGDGVWVPFRGGAFAQVPRTDSVQQLAVVPGTDPHIEVYAFGTPLAPRAYTLTTTQRVTPGANPATS